MASLDNPVYSAAVVTETGKRIVLTKIITALNRDESKGELAQKVSLTIANVKHEGSYLSALIKERNRIFIYANTGSKAEEVFRGFIWTKSEVSGLQKELKLVCYDNLIYFQSSEDSVYFSSGKTTKAICKELCENWGVKLNYEYKSITHPKMPLSGTLSDIFLTDLLDEVKKKTGDKYVMRSIKDVIHISPIASNKTIYSLAAKQNAIQCSSEVSMAGMVTRVIITGKEDEDERKPIETTKSRNTEKYGTLQKVMTSSDADSLAEAKEEAETLLKEKSVPERTYTVEAVDIPWVRKGDRVNLAAGGLKGSFTVASVSRTGFAKTMALTLEKYTAASGSAGFKEYRVRVTTNGGMLRIRSQPGTNYSIVAGFYNGDTTTIVGEASGQGASNWGKLKDGRGWISLDWVRRI